MTETPASEAGAEREPLDCWALVELFGHARLAGRVSEHTLGSQVLLRVDVPAPDGSTAYTRFVGPSAIYSLTPISRELCLRIGAARSDAPAVPYLPPPPGEFLGQDHNDDDDDDDDDEDVAPF